MKLLLIFLLFAVATQGLASEPLFNIPKLKSQAIEEVRRKYTLPKDHQLELVEIRIFDNHDGKLSSMSLQLNIADMASLSEGQFSKYQYDTYWVRFALLTGKLIKIKESKYGHYEPLDNKILQ